jgi:thymidine phosphorylase
MVPADRKLYALRDVTGTVPSIPLITSSILSKKLAEGLEALIMDVKFGAAAFMETKDQALELAQSIVRLARDCDMNTRALITDMNTPLGRAAGNWLEVKESVECLEGRGPEDLRQLVIDCAAHLLVQTHRAADLDSARNQALACLASGEPTRKWDELLTAQGADFGAFKRKLALDHIAPVVRELKAERSGFVSRCDARIIGEVVRDLGGGRLTKDTTINSDVGVDALAKPGERREAGSSLCRVHAPSESAGAEALVHLSNAFMLSTDPAPRQTLIHEVM